MISSNISTNFSDRVKRRYPQYFEVPDDCDSLHSDSTECLSDIDPDMEPVSNNLDLILDIGGIISAVVISLLGS